MKEKDIIYGIKPLFEALKSGEEIEKVYIKKGSVGESIAELRQLLKKRHIPTHTVEEYVLNGMHRGNHQGIIAYISSVTYIKLPELVQQTFESGETPLFMILDCITDVRNFGAIARTAECAGLNGIIIPDKGSAMIGGDAMKTSAGALMNIPVCREHKLINTADFLKNCGIQLVACSEYAKQSYDQVDMKLPTAIVMGSEDEGISRELLSVCDYSARIPMFGKTASLNVSVAAGIIIYEALKQRNQS